jgi:hypothetical protein
MLVQLMCVLLGYHPAYAQLTTDLEGLHGQLVVAMGCVIKSALCDSIVCQLLQQGQA